jgi:hypothetical protein
MCQVVDKFSLYALAVSRSFPVNMRSILDTLFVHNKFKVINL